MFNFFKKKKSEARKLSPEAERYTAEACLEYDAKMGVINEGEWQLLSCEDWGMDPDTGILTVNLPNGSQWQADAQFLASYCTKDETWQWAWDSPDKTNHLCQDSLLVKAVGEKYSIRYLLIEGGAFPMPAPEFSDYLCAIGLKATGASGLMKAQAGGIEGYMIITLKNLTWIKHTA